ncbi:MAG: DUF3592 domain-containing protein [Planctomycetales bacterium]|nr:DUF3592 domain-containing protein [Planctomycetales bacterium]
MVRRFRIYGKKRGDRRTGSERLGSIGEFFFHSAILLLGMLSFYLLLVQLIWPEWKANRHFVEHACVVRRFIVSDTGRDAEGKTLYRPEVFIEHEYEGQTLRTWALYDIAGTTFYDEREAQDVVAQFRIGSKYQCWYDPADPTTIVLTRGYSWWMWLYLIVPLSFVTLGTIGMVRAALHSGTSAERRSALASKAAQIDLFDDRAARGLDYPNVPPPAPIADSPGTHLKYRLPVDSSEGWRFGVMWLACSLWNLIVTWLAAALLWNFSSDTGHWLSLVALIPFVAGGIAILIFCIRHSIRSAAVGTAGVEISEIPVEPGKQYDLYFFHSGHGKLENYRLLLACDEFATFRQGTDSRSESARMYEKALFEAAQVDLGRDLHFADTCRLEIPYGVMHSFRSAHNEVQWKLIVQADAGKRGPYVRRFPLIVYPSPAGSET